MLPISLSETWHFQRQPSSGTSDVIKAHASDHSNFFAVVVLRHF